MNVTTVGIGIAAIVYGVYTGWARTARPEQFHKLGPMREKWGETGGNAVHLVGYTVVPILVGAMLVYSGLHGGSVF